MKRRAVVEVISALKEPESRPSVTINRIADGSIVYSVKSTGSTSKIAASRAMETFRELAQFAILMKDKELDEAIQKTLDRTKRKPPELAHK